MSDTLPISSPMNIDHMVVSGDRLIATPQRSPVRSSLQRSRTSPHPRMNGNMQPVIPHMAGEPVQPVDSRLHEICCAPELPSSTKESPRKVNIHLGSDESIVEEEESKRKCGFFLSLFSCSTEPREQRSTSRKPKIGVPSSNPLNGPTTPTSKRHSDLPGTVSNTMEKTLPLTHESPLMQAINQISKSRKQVTPKPQANSPSSVAQCPSSIDEANYAYQQGPSARFPMDEAAYAFHVPEALYQPDGTISPTPVRFSGGDLASHIMRRDSESTGGAISPHSNLHLQTDDTASTHGQLRLPVRIDQLVQQRQHQMFLNGMRSTSFCTFLPTSESSTPVHAASAGAVGQIVQTDVLAASNLQNPPLAPLVQRLRSPLPDRGSVMEPEPALHAQDFVDSTSNPTSPDVSPAIYSHHQAASPIHAMQQPENDDGSPSQASVELEAELPLEHLSETVHESLVTHHTQLDQQQYEKRDEPSSTTTTGTSSPKDLSPKLKESKHRPSITTSVRSTTSTSSAMSGFAPSSSSSNSHHSAHMYGHGRNESVTSAYGGASGARSTTIGLHSHSSARTHGSDADVAGMLHRDHHHQLSQSISTPTTQTGGSTPFPDLGRQGSVERSAAGRATSPLSPSLNQLSLTTGPFGSVAKAQDRSSFNDDLDKFLAAPPKHPADKDSRAGRSSAGGPSYGVTPLSSERASPTNFSSQMMIQDESTHRDRTNAPLLLSPKRFVGSSASPSPSQHPSPTSTPFTRTKRGTS